MFGDDSKPLSEFGTTGQLFGKFLVLIVPVFIATSLVGLSAITQLSVKSEQEGQIARIASTARLVAASISSEDFNNPNQFSTVKRQLSIVAADPGVACVRLVDGTGTIRATVPDEATCLQATSSPSNGSMTARLTPTSLGHIFIGLDNTRLAQASSIRNQYIVVTTIVGLLATLLATWLGFRTVVERPVRLLLAAIRDTASGKVAKVEGEVPDDELGTVISSFNEMQEKLGLSARQNAEALAQLENLYNETPALMFSVAPNGTILSVSGHWLEKTGYEREDVIGMPLSDFVRYEGSSVDIMPESPAVMSSPATFPCSLSASPVMRSMSCCHQCLMTPPERNPATSSV
jgi:PAS domain-containing protein